MPPEQNPPTPPIQEPLPVTPFREDVDEKKGGNFLFIIALTALFVLVGGPVGIKYFEQKSATPELTLSSNLNAFPADTSSVGTSSLEFSGNNLGGVSSTSSLTGTSSTSNTKKTATNTLATKPKSTTSLGATSSTSSTNSSTQATYNTPATTISVSCNETEEVLQLQNFFLGSTIQFSRPMVYLEWNEQKGCAPSLASAPYILRSGADWNATNVDKSKIVEHPINPVTVYAVEKRILVRKGGYYGSTVEYYVIRDSNGVVTASPSFIFDLDTDGEVGKSGSFLYTGGLYAGHIVSNISAQVWLQAPSNNSEDPNAYTPI